MHVACIERKQARKGCWASHWESDSLKQAHCCSSLTHRIRATPRFGIPAAVHQAANTKTCGCCLRLSTTGLVRLQPTTSSRGSILEFPRFSRVCQHAHLTYYHRQPKDFKSAGKSAASQRLGPPAVALQLANGAAVYNVTLLLPLQAAAPVQQRDPSQSWHPRRSRDPLLLPEGVVSHHDCAISSFLVIRQAIRALPTSYSQGANQCSSWRAGRIFEWSCPMLGHYEPL